VPDAPLSVGPRLSAMAVYLSVFQHVPVERAQFLIADLTGGVVSAGFVHSCLGKAAGLVSDAVRLIRTLIAASPVAGFDETTLRSGPAGDKKYVHGAFTELYSGFHLGTRSLETMKEAGILPSFAGIAVSDRYAGYYSETWANFAGHQACAAHLVRDFADCAGTCPGAAWPEQAIRSLRGLTRAWHTAREQGLAAIPAEDREPLELEFRRAVTVGLAAVSRVPGPKNKVKQRPGREMLEFCRDRQAGDGGRCLGGAERVDRRFRDQRDLDRCRPLVPGVCLCRLGQPVADLTRGERERGPAVTELDRATQRAAGTATDPKRHLLLDGVRLNGDLAELAVGTVVDGGGRYRGTRAARAWRRRYAHPGPQTGLQGRRTPSLRNRSRRRATADPRRPGLGCRTAWRSPAGDSARKSSDSGLSRVMPALATIMSSRPNSACASLNAADRAT
jgi:Transposase IS66 family